MPVRYRMAGALQVDAVAGPFPLVVSANGRFLQTIGGTPRRLHGTTAWEATNELNPADWELYLQDCVARGFNALIMQATNPVKYVTSSNAPANYKGDLPWLKNTSGTTWTGVFANHDADFSTPNPTYFDYFDYQVTRARIYGIAVIADHMYNGFNFGAGDGWWQDMLNAANTQAVCLAFGQNFLGPRWVKHTNLILDWGTDMFPTPSSEGEARMIKIVDGLRAAGCAQLLTAHWSRSSDSLDNANTASRITLNSVYPGQGGSSYAPPHARCRRAYARTPPIPAVCVEMKYEGEAPVTRTNSREEGWWAILSVIAGVFYGNNPEWVFDTAFSGGGSASWKGHLSDPGRLDHQVMGAFLDSIAWSKLVPDDPTVSGTRTLVTAGGGSAQTIGSVGSGDSNDGTDWVAAAADPAGSILVAYVPTAHTGTISLAASKMAGTFREYWVDPTNGSATTPTTGIAASGTRTISTPGTNNAGAADWVLVWVSP